MKLLRKWSILDLLTTWCLPTIHREKTCLFARKTCSCVMMRRPVFTRGVVVLSRTSHAERWMFQGVFSYRLHHNKAPSFTTIWDHVLGTCFKHLKQIQVAFPNFALTMPMPIIKWVIKNLLTHHTSSVTAIMHISISMFLVFLKSQRSTWATGKKKTTRIWSKNPSKTPKLWKHPRPKQSTGGNFPISVLGWVASGH